VIRLKLNCVKLGILMSRERFLRAFRKQVSLDENLRGKLEAANDFREVVNLANVYGYQFTYEQLKSHAESVVDLSSQEQEEESISINNSGTIQSKDSRSRRWNWFGKRNRVDIWDYQMSRLLYFDPNPTHDSDARLREKGG